jgi:hypothetical protein
MDSFASNQPPAGPGVTRCGCGEIHHPGMEHGQEDISKCLTQGPGIMGRVVSTEMTLPACVWLLGLSGLA